VVVTGGHNVDGVTGGKLMVGGFGAKKVVIHVFGLYLTDHFLGAFSNSSNILLISFLLVVDMPASLVVTMFDPLSLQINPVVVTPALLLEAVCTTYSTFSCVIVGHLCLCNDGTTSADTSVAPTFVSIVDTIITDALSFTVIHPLKCVSTVAVVVVVVVVVVGAGAGAGAGAVSIVVAYVVIVIRSITTQ
jgi:hypothetical protein